MDITDKEERKRKKTRLLRKDVNVLVKGYNKRAKGIYRKEVDSK